MKKILIILDGVVAKKLLDRIIEANTSDNSYDVVYMNDLILPIQKPSNFTFYKFDPTSKSKLDMVLNKDIHTEVLVALNSKSEMQSVIENVRKYKTNLRMIVLDNWDMGLEDEYIDVYKGIEVLANGMVEQLPNVPVLAQNVGLKQGEIMEIKVPFGSSYAYRYIGSIEQKEWRIFGLYRNGKMITIKPTSILKPNDTILAIGKPKVLMQIYNVIGKATGQFPMPFGNKFYLYLDLYLESKEEEIKKTIEDAKFLNQRLKNKQLIIRITRPTTAPLLNYIKNELKGDESIILEIDYGNLGFKKLTRKDFRKYYVGMMILSTSMCKRKDIIKHILELNIPLFKLGKESIKSVKNTAVLLNDTKSYEQIAPVVFDVASQIQARTKVFDLDPIGDEEDNDKSYLIDHFENLAKIFNERIEIISGTKNPIRQLKEQKDMLQVLPLKEEMFSSRLSFKFLYTNSDFISFDMNKYNQLLVPVSQD